MLNREEERNSNITQGRKIARNSLVVAVVVDSGREGTEVAAAVTAFIANSLAAQHTILRPLGAT